MYLWILVLHVFLFFCFFPVLGAWKKNKTFKKDFSMSSVKHPHENWWWMDFQILLELPEYWKYFIWLRGNNILNMVCGWEIHINSSSEIVFFFWHWRFCNIIWINFLTSWFYAGEVQSVFKTITLNGNLDSAVKIQSAVVSVPWVNS